MWRICKGWAKVISVAITPYMIDASLMYPQEVSHTPELARVGLKAVCREGQSPYAIGDKQTTRANIRMQGLGFE